MALALAGRRRHLRALGIARRTSVRPQAGVNVGRAGAGGQASHPPAAPAAATRNGVRAAPGPTARRSGGSGAVDALAPADRCAPPGRATRPPPRSSAARHGAARIWRPPATAPAGSGAASPRSRAPPVNLAMGLISRFELDEGAGASPPLTAARPATTPSSTAARPGRCPGARTPSFPTRPRAALRRQRRRRGGAQPDVPANNAPQRWRSSSLRRRPGTALGVCVSPTQSSSETRLKLGFNDGKVRPGSPAAIPWWAPAPG